MFPCSFYEPSATDLIGIGYRQSVKIGVYLCILSKEFARRPLLYFGSGTNNRGGAAGRTMQHLIGQSSRLTRAIAQGASPHFSMVMSISGSQESIDVVYRTHCWVVYSLCEAVMQEDFFSYEGERNSVHGRWGKEPDGWAGHNIAYSMNYQTTLVYR